MNRCDVEAKEVSLAAVLAIIFRDLILVLPKIKSWKLGFYMVLVVPKI